MKTNMGSVDRIARIILGAAVLGAGYYYQSIWGAIGAVPLLTGLLGWCPLYIPLKIDTK